MIEIKKLTKKFGNQTVLNNINITFPRYGLVAICGPSGCGKSTLLNIISSLCDFQGEVSFNGKQYSLMKQNELDELRNLKIGFVFQDYKLFEFETVYKNLLLALDMKSNDSKESKQRRIKDLLKIVGLSHKENVVVSKLSGGEKQRVAIARAIANSPPLVLADEPTGNLDVKNSENIMLLLEKIAKSSLVIMVSHDEELTNKYADEIIYLKDGKVADVVFKNKRNHVDILPLAKISKKDNKARLPLGFCFSHSLNNIKRRKWRTMIVFLSTSLGLVGVGLGTVISKIVSTNLYKSYSSIIDANKVVLQSRDKKDKGNLITSISEWEVNELYETYYEDISAKGVYYWNDFNNMFTYYDYSLSLSGSKKSLPFYSVNNLNDYELIKNTSNIIYPLQVQAISNNDVVLGMNYSVLNEICFQLQIERSTKSLSEYLLGNSLSLNLDVRNDAWGYENSVSFNIIGFTMEKRNIFYHSNPKWNEFVFEDLMHFTTTDVINSNTKNPWDLKKSYYFEFRKNRDIFLKDMRFDRENRDLIGEILDKKYCPISCGELETFECKRVALLSRNNNDKIAPFYGEYIKKSSKYITHLTYGNDSAFVIYPDNLMMGFSRLTFLSKSFEQSEDIIDIATYLKYENSMNINAPSEVLTGHFTRSNSEGLTFSPKYGLLSGRPPMNYGEIVISKTIIEKMGLETPLNSIIYLSFPLSEELLPNGYLKRDYKIIDLKVVGVSDLENYSISHDESWTFLFFQTMVGISGFDLGITGVALDVNEGKENEVIDSLKRAFPNFEASWPISSVKDSVEKVCGYIEKLLLIISLISVVIAALILYLCNYLHFMEIKKDIGLVRCLGISKNESTKFIYVHSFLMGMISFIFSSVQLLIICLILSKSFSSMFAIEDSFIFEPKALLYMFILSSSISLLSSLLTRRSVNSLDPLACLR